MSYCGAILAKSSSLETNVKSGATSLVDFSGSFPEAEAWFEFSPPDVFPFRSNCVVHYKMCKYVFPLLISLGSPWNASLQCAVVLDTIKAPIAKRIEYFILTVIENAVFVLGIWRNLCIISERDLIQLIPMHLLDSKRNVLSSVWW